MIVNSKVINLLVHQIKKDYEAENSKNKSNLFDNDEIDESLDTLGFMNKSDSYGNTKSKF